MGTILASGEKICASGMCPIAAVERENRLT